LLQGLQHILSELAAAVMVVAAALSLNRAAATLLRWIRRKRFLDIHLRVLH
jgi:hypothetical protein